MKPSDHGKKAASKPRSYAKAGMRQNMRTTISARTVVYDLTIESRHDNLGAVVGIIRTSLDVTGQQSRERTDFGANVTLQSAKKRDNL